MRVRVSGLKYEVFEQEQTELTESFLKFLFSLLPPVKKLRAVTGGIFG